jgi:hypothetical protein
VSTAFALTWAAVAAPLGFEYTVQVQRPGSARRQAWQTTTGAGGQFTPDGGTGTYLFRMRLQQSGLQIASGWAKASIQVS